jgi:hypothetical protein
MIEFSIHHSIAFLYYDLVHLIYLNFGSSHARLLISLRFLRFYWEDKMTSDSYQYVKPAAGTAKWLSAEQLNEGQTQAEKNLQFADFHGQGGGQSGRVNSADNNDVESSLPQDHDDSIDRFTWWKEASSSEFDKAFARGGQFSYVKWNNHDFTRVASLKDLKQYFDNFEPTISPMPTLQQPMKNMQNAQNANIIADENANIAKFSNEHANIAGKKSSQKVSVSVTSSILQKTVASPQRLAEQWAEDYKLLEDFSTGEELLTNTNQNTLSNQYNTVTSNKFRLPSELLERQREYMQNQELEAQAAQRRSSNSQNSQVSSIFSAQDTYKFSDIFKRRRGISPASISDTRETNLVSSGLLPEDNLVSSTLELRLKEIRDELLGARIVYAAVRILSKFLILCEISK